MPEIEVLDSLFDSPPPTRGGKRVGAGRKPNGYVKPQPVQDFETARARNELAKAKINEIEAKVKADEYVERAAVRQAAATAMSSIAQTLRSIPDLLERRLGIDPTLAEEIGRQIDESLNELAEEFRLMGGGDA
jgi:phage terminase Nu1 subunit (DNA packaging protein)